MCELIPQKGRKSSVFGVDFEQKRVLFRLTFCETPKNGKSGVLEKKVKRVPFLSGKRCFFEEKRVAAGYGGEKFCIYPLQCRKCENEPINLLQWDIIGTKIVP